jgi:hypothetical protein
MPMMLMLASALELYNFMETRKLKCHKIEKKDCDYCIGEVSLVQPDHIVNSHVHTGPDMV